MATAMAAGDAARPMSKEEKSHLRIVTRHHVGVVRLLLIRHARLVACVRRGLYRASVWRARFPSPRRHDRTQIHVPRTILIMGVSTFIVGLLPNYASIGVAAPIILIILRMLRGLALSGEYGGAATYVAEHAPHGKRGLFTSWIQTTATRGLFLSLMVILAVRTAIGKAAADWGWRIPFLLSIILFSISV